MDKLLQILKEKMDSEVFTEELQADLKDEMQILVNEQVKKKVSAEKKRLNKELKEQTEKDLKEFKESFVDKLDGYTDYAAGKFFKKHKPVMESTFKVELAEEVISAIKAVLEQYQVEIPQPKQKKMEDLQESVKKVKQELKDLFKENVELKKQVTEYEKSVTFMKLTEDISDKQKEEVLSLLEGLQFADVKDFERKTKRCIAKVQETNENDVDETELNEDDSASLNDVEPKEKQTILESLIPKKK